MMLKATKLPGASECLGPNSVSPSSVGSPGRKEATGGASPGPQPSWFRKMNHHSSENLH